MTTPGEVPGVDASAATHAAEAAAGRRALPAQSVHPVHPGVRSPRPPDDRAARTHAQLMPTLFDRLRDDAPGRAGEASSEYAVTPSQMRDIVQRDLAFLLNTANAEDLIDRERHPEAAASTVNFGVPPLAGSHISERRWSDIERIVRRAIADYEPRLLPETVKVTPLMKEGASGTYNVLLFEIRALIHLAPYPLELTVQSSIDLETSRVSIGRPSRHPSRAAR
jgi:type VI secretion system protein ImpF